MNEGYPLPTAAPTSMYLGHGRLVVVVFVMLALVWGVWYVVVEYLKKIWGKIRWPQPIRARRRTDLSLDEKVYLLYTQARYEEVVANPSHYYMMDESGNNRKIVPLEPDAFISPYRAYLPIPKSSKLSSAESPSMRTPSRNDGSVSKASFPLNRSPVPGIPPSMGRLMIQIPQKMNSAEDDRVRDEIMTPSPLKDSLLKSDIFQRSVDGNINM